MAHEIEVAANGDAAFFAARQSAWHRLGTTTTEAQTAEIALELAHLSGWDVRKAPLTALATGTDGEELHLPVGDKYATVRNNPFTGKPEPLGVVGKVYQPIQNEEHTELLNTLIDQSGAHFETAGSLRSGREVFVTMKMPEHMMIGGVDQLDLYIAAMNSHDGTTPFRFVVTPIRVVCANTQRAALAHAVSTFSIRHTKSAKSNIEAARQALALTFKYQDEFQQAAERMVQETMTEDHFQRYIDHLFPAPAKNASDRVRANHREKTLTLDMLFTDAQTNHEIRGTQWAGYQAITEYIDHYAPAQRTQWANDPEVARALSSLSKNAVNLKERAFELATA